MCRAEFGGGGGGGGGLCPPLGELLPSLDFWKVNAIRPYNLETLSLPP